MTLTMITVTKFALESVNHERNLCSIIASYKFLFLATFRPPFTFVLLIKC